MLIFCIGYVVGLILLGGSLWVMWRKYIKNEKYTIYVFSMIVGLITLLLTIGFHSLAIGDAENIKNGFHGNL